MADAPSPSSALHPPRRHLRSLTSLRFFAAFWVVIFHFTLPYLGGLPEPLQQIILHGQQGVTLFFVLSGFILAYTYGGRAAQGKLKRRDFWRARFARVYPVFAFSLLIALPLTLIDLRARHPEDLKLFAVGVPLYGLLLHSWWHPLIYRLQWNTPSWSLSAEAFFYFAFPWIAPLFVRLRGKQALGAALGLVALMVAIHLGYALLDPDHAAGALPDPTNHFWSGIVYYNPLLRLPEFAFGIAIAGLIEPVATLFDRRPGRAYAALAVAVAGLALLFAWETTAFGAAFVEPCAVLLFGVLILILAVEKTPVADRFLALPTLILLGEASYAMYMLQRPMSSIVDAIAVRVHLGLISDEKLTLCGFLIVLVFASIAAYKTIEVPFRNRLRPQAAPPPAA